MTLTLLGNVPAKKNSKRLISRGGRRFFVPSQLHEDWHTEQLWKLTSVKERFQRAKVSVVFYFPDRRRKDLSNALESVLDLLVDAEILADDSWEHLPEVHVRFGGVDKRPRAEVEVTDID